MMPDSTIQNNISIIRQRVEIAARKSGRKPEDILVLAVTKTVDIDQMRKAYDCGLIDFGENRVQEYIRKTDIIDKDCNWHIIGSIQTNKVKYLDNRIKLIHSLDRIELAQALQAKGMKSNIHWNVLVQVNVSGEDTKSGIEPLKLKNFVKEVSGMGNIHIKGLMTIAPYSENSEDVRWVFRDLKKLAVDIIGERMDNISMDFLSMGMSNDFEVAIEEGANIVRIGSLIFGERVYTP